MLYLCNVKIKQITNLEPAATDKRHKIMKTFNDFKSDLYNMIEKAIMNGVSGSTIADTLVSNLHISRENALTMVVSVGAQLNLQNNPNMTWQEAFKSFAF